MDGESIFIIKNINKLVWKPTKKNKIKNNVELLN
jgi:hypothetical protein